MTAALSPITFALLFGALPAHQSGADAPEAPLESGCVHLFICSCCTNNRALATMKEMQHLRQLDSEKCKPHVESCSNDESPRQERQRQKETDRQCQRETESQTGHCSHPSRHPLSRENTYSQVHPTCLTHKTGKKKCSGCFKSLSFKTVSHEAINN